MANTKRANTNNTATKRTANTKAAKTATKTKAVKEPEIVEEVVEEVVEEEIPVEEIAEETVKEKKQFHADDMILCRSTVSGKVTMEGDLSKNIYRWIDYGSVCDVEYRDLVNAVRRHSTFIFAPRIIIDDEDFIEEFSDLKKFYREQFTVKELAEIIDMDDNDIYSAVEVLPKGAKEELTNLVSTYIANGTIDSIRKIKTFENVLGVDFSMVADAQ